MNGATITLAPFGTGWQVAVEKDGRTREWSYLGHEQASRALKRVTMDIVEGRAPWRT